MAKHYKPRLRLTLADQCLLREIFILARSLGEGEGEGERDKEIADLFHKIVSKTQ